MSGKEYSYLKKIDRTFGGGNCSMEKKIKKFLEDKSHFEQILRKGREKANIIAEENLKNIREKIGLI